MSVVTLLVAMVCGLLFCGSGLVVAVAAKRAFFADWVGSQAVITVVLLWICWALALGQLLGAVGLLRRGALLVGALATAGVAVARASLRPGERADGNAADRDAADEVAADRDAADEVAADRAAADEVAADRAAADEVAADRAAADEVAADRAAVDGNAAGGEGAEVALMALTALLVLLVAAIWVARTVIAVHRGINDPDSLGYHLPFATTFVQTGYANQHRFVLPYLPVHFYPANDELLQAMALALTHSVAFSVVRNLLFGGFILVAAHALGNAYRAGRAAVAAAAIVLGLPVIAFSQPGEAVNDALLVLVLVGGLALLARARDKPAAYVLAGACAGVAIGIKFSAGYPAAMLGILTLLFLRSRVRGHRWRCATATSLAAVALGGSWYLRNAITYGNPVPPTKISLGPIHLRQIVTADGAKSFSVLDYLKHGLYLSQFRHGLALGLGPLVAVVVAVWLLGAILALASRDWFRRGLGLFALASAVGYAATPASAFGLAGPGHSVTAFVINLHYAAAALIVGLIAFAVAVGRSRGAWLLPAVGVAIVATSIRPGQRIAFWSPEIGGGGFKWLIAAAVLAAAAATRSRVPPRRRGDRAIDVGAWGAVLGAAVVGMLAVGLIARRYPSQPATDSVQVWAARADHAKVAAWVPDIALLYGPGSRNHVVTLTELSAHAPVPLSSCPAWMATVIAGHYNYSAVLPLTAWNQWLAADPAFRLVAEDQLAVVYQVVGTPNVSCPGQT